MGASKPKTKRAALIILDTSGFRIGPRYHSVEASLSPRPVPARGHDGWCRQLKVATVADATGSETGPRKCILTTHRTRGHYFESKWHWIVHRYASGAERSSVDVPKNSPILAASRAVFLGVHFCGVGSGSEGREWTFGELPDVRRAEPAGIVLGDGIPVLSRILTGIDLLPHSPLCGLREAGD